MLLCTRSTLVEVRESGSDLIIAKEYNPDRDGFARLAVLLDLMPSHPTNVSNACRDFAPSSSRRKWCMAEASGCTVEVVNSSEILKQLGGVGALLRYTQVSNPRRDLVQT